MASTRPPRRDRSRVGPPQPGRGRLVGVVGGMVLVAFLLTGCSRGRPKAATAGGIPPDGAVPSRTVGGFDQVAFQVHSSGTSATAAATKRCALYAYTKAQQDQGLMHRLDLAGYDGMVFKFAQPSTAQFYMKDTLIPLSIAWFDASGLFVSTTDMTPCGNAAVCPLYAADAPYTVAIEVLKGQLPQLGIGSGSTISVGGAC